MTEYWYFPKPQTGMESICETEEIVTKEIPLIEFQVEKAEQGYLAKCKNPQFAVHGKDVKELKKHIEETYHLIEAEFRRSYDT